MSERLAAALRQWLAADLPTAEDYAAASPGADGVARAAIAPAEQRADVSQGEP